MAGPSRRRRRMRVGLPFLGLLLFLASAAGCGGTDEPPPPVMTLSLGLGTIDTRLYGDTRWVDLVDDKPLELAPGAQGGFHVWLLYRVGENNRDRRVRVERIADRLGGDGSRQRVLTTSNNIDLPADSPYETPMPIPSFMCPTPIGVNILDAPLEFMVRVSEAESATGLLAEKRVRIQPSCPPIGDPQRDFCMNICTG
jgi:hypothetical protein